MLAPKNETTMLTDAGLGDHGDNVESYAAMSREALNMAHCSDAFFDAAEGFILIRLVKEINEGPWSKKPRTQILTKQAHWHGDNTDRHKA